MAPPEPAVVRQPETKRSNPLRLLDPPTWTLLALGVVVVLGIALAFAGVWNGLFGTGGSVLAVGETAGAALLGALAAAVAAGFLLWWHSRLRGTVGEHDDRLGRLQTATTRTASGLTDLERRTDTRFAQAKEQLERNITQAQDAVRLAVRKVDEKVAGQDARVGSVESALAELAGTLRASNAETAEAQQALLREVQSSLESLQRDIEDAGNALGNELRAEQKAMLADLEDAIAHAQRGATQASAVVEDRLQEQAASLAESQEEANALQRDLAALRTRLTDHQAEATATTARLLEMEDRLEERLRSLDGHAKRLGDDLADIVRQEVENAKAETSELRARMEAELAEQMRVIESDRQALDDTEARLQGLENDVAQSAAMARSDLDHHRQELEARMEERMHAGLVAAREVVESIIDRRRKYLLLAGALFLGLLIALLLGFLGLKSPGIWSVHQAFAVATVAILVLGIVLGTLIFALVDAVRIVERRIRIEERPA